MEYTKRAVRFSPRPPPASTPSTPSPTGLRSAYRLPTLGVASLITRNLIRLPIYINSLRLYRI